MANPKRFSKSFLTIIRYLSNEPTPRSINEISEDTGIHIETIRVTLKQWEDYFRDTNTHPNRFTLDTTNPDARAVAKQYAYGVDGKKKTEQKKWYYLTPDDMKTALGISSMDLFGFESNIAKFLTNERPSQGNKAEIKKTVHILERYIYRLMEVEYKSAD